MLSTLNTIVDNIETLTNQQNAALCWHDKMHEIFYDGLDNDEVAALNITKEDLASLSANPKAGIPVDPKNPNYWLNGAQMTPYVQTFGIIGGWSLVSLHMEI